MSWTERVKCAPCQGTTDWIVEDGSWTCHHCGHKMTFQEIKVMHRLQDCERWLAAEKEWRESV